MSLLAAYQQFLASPNSANLSADAIIYYVTTTTIVKGSTEIIKHIGSTRKLAKKNKEAVLSSVENTAAGGLALEVDTAIEFLTGGGPYLPALDDNFLADRKVSLSITHFVSFDSAGKISQIRQSWDQGALLKQIDVIGKSGRNWPIGDAAEQIKLIAHAVTLTRSSGSAASGSKASALPVRSRGNSTRGDPHASLELFASREERESQAAAASVVAPYGGVRPQQRDVTDILSDGPADGEGDTVAVVSPYAGRRPQQRSFEEILGDEDDDEVDETDVVGDSPSARGRTGRLRSRSPTKYIAPKGGANKNFQPVRLFEADEAAAAALKEDDDNRSPERYYRPNPKRYDHFDIADGSDPQDAPKAAAPPKPTSKHGSQWSFEQFTEQPETRKPRGQDVRHFGIENDEFPETPSAAGRKQAPARPRPDAETHFEFQDDGEPSGEQRISRPRGAGHNAGLGLYENNLYKEDGTAPTPGPARALGNITNLKDRSKMFDPHFAMTDKPESPVSTAARTAAASAASDDRKKAVKMLEANWATDFDDPSSKENAPIPGTNVTGKNASQRGITIGGDGMGGKKEGRSWSFGGDDDPNEPAAVPGKKPSTANQASDFWNF
ncbi:hypothetical protein F503_02244 [Ophiostoma piceae UAMH 11346]|uniref:Ntf2-like protein n=1 Tax=Ophiostoma piceae (strain UAMH 11346) TaxID=1262450 RepID=S3CXC6_OPHP1|nr:hypothetical protein F503_02244 [Ophiostoma piceae UAMH 11346]